MTHPRTLFVGIGSPHGDDQAGWLVAQWLDGRFDRDRIAVRKAKSPMDLLDWLDGVERLILCDACRGLGNIGDIRRWTWPDAELLNAAWSGTHDLPLPAVLQLADRIGCSVRDVVVYAIETKTNDPLNSASKRVMQSVPIAAQRIASELGVLPLLSLRSP